MNQLIRKGLRAGLAAMLVAAFAIPVAVADQQVIDTDTATAGLQNIASVSGASGVTINASGVLGIKRSGSNHLANGDPLTFVVDAAATTLPSGYSVSTVNGAAPANWSTAAANTEVTIGTSAISFAAPTTCGSYSYAVKWNETHNYGNKLTGAAAETINLQVTGCSTEPPVTQLSPDTTPPTFSCGSADAIWHDANQSVSCTAGDPVVAGQVTSGLTTPASFTLSTNVAAGDETASAMTGTAGVCDGRLQCVTAGPVGPFKIDRKGPGITISAPTGTYIVGESVSSSVACTDGGSGMVGGSASCPTGAAVDTSVGTHTFNVTASDYVGNSSSASSNYLATYKICNLTSTASKKSGSTLPVKIQICNASSAPLGNVGTVLAGNVAILVGGTDVTAAEDAGASNPDANFRWDSTANQYIYNLQLKDKATGANLPVGTYQLKFTVANDPLAHSVAFTVGK